ncbi:MAG: VanW family protein [Armatimonadota bacterium]
MSVQSELGDTDIITAAEPAHAAARIRLRRTLMIAGVAAATLLAAGFIALVVATRLFVASGRIAPGVSIAGVEVSGMTREQALAALRTQWVPTLPDPVTVTFPGGEWEATREELGVGLRLEEAVDQALRVGREGGLLAQIGAHLGLSGGAIDIPVAVEVDEETLEDAVGGLAEVVDREPVNADIKVVGAEVEVIPGQVGRALNIEATMAAVRQALADPSAAQVAAVVETREPAVTAEDLSHIEVVLGQYSTRFNPGRVDRTHNLRLAVSKLNETVLHPGEVFSFNQTVGERAVAEGWREAPIFIDGDVQPSTGGGICQVATTTYNAALLANLDMVERHHHSRPVDYVPAGRDATVYWGQYDLRFRNSLKHPILILAEVGSSTVSVRILGARSDDAEVEIVREGLMRIPHETKQIEDPELEEGKTEVEKPGRDGWRVTVYRKARRGGELVRDERLHTDFYAPQTEVVRVGTKPPEKPEKPEEGAGPKPPVRAPAPPAALPPASGGSAPPAPAPAPSAGGASG